VGVPLFLLLTGYRAGPLQHYRYLQLKGLDKKKRKTFVKRMKWQYMWYGAVYLLLQLAPLLSMVFLVTAAASSALWAADLERKIRQQEASSPVDGGQLYRDDPHDQGEVV
jgi:hypothetical protein